MIVVLYCFINLALNLGVSTLLDTRNWRQWYYSVRTVNKTFAPVKSQLAGQPAYDVIICALSAVSSPLCYLLLGDNYPGITTNHVQEYWSVGGSHKIPITWPSEYSTGINLQRPAPVTLNSHRAYTFLSVGLAATKGFVSVCLSGTKDFLFVGLAETIGFLSAGLAGTKGFLSVDPPGGSG